MNNLTKMEIKILNAMRKNEYCDSLYDGCSWVFSVIDYSGLSPQQARGVISSLVKKGLVEVDSYRNEEPCIGFTDKGKQLFENADGEECCWGGKKLLKEI